MHSLASVISPPPLSSKLSAATFHPILHEATHLTPSSMPPAPAAASPSPKGPPCARPLPSSSLRNLSHSSQPKSKPRAARDPFLDFSSSVAPPTVVPQSVAPSSVTTTTTAATAAVAPCTTSRPRYIPSFHSFTIDTDDESDDEPTPFESFRTSGVRACTPQHVFPTLTSPLFAAPSIPSHTPPAAKPSFLLDSLKRDGLHSDSDDEYDDDVDDNLEYGDDDVDSEHDGLDAQWSDAVSDSEDDDASPLHAPDSASSQLRQLFEARSQPIPVPGRLHNDNNFARARSVHVTTSNAHNQDDAVTGVEASRPLTLCFLPPGSRRRAMSAQPSTSHATTSLVVGRPSSARRQSVQFDERAFY